MEGRFLNNHMVESTEAGEIDGISFNDHRVIWFQGKVVFALSSQQKQVKSRGDVLIIIWSFGSKVNSYLHC